MESAAKRFGKEPLAYLRETMVDVVEVEPRFAGKSFNDIKKNDVPGLRKELLQGSTDAPNPYGRPYPWKQIGLDVYLSRNTGFDHMVDSAKRRGLGKNDSVPDIHMEAVANFPKLMENAVIGETASDPTGKFNAIHRAYSCMRVNGETYVVKITVLQEANNIAQASIESVQRVRDLQLMKKMPPEIGGKATLFDVLEGLYMTEKEVGQKGPKKPKELLINPVSADQ